jgi:hypothetical protein
MATHRAVVAAAGLLGLALLAAATATAYHVQGPWNRMPPRTHDRLAGDEPQEPPFLEVARRIKN